ncbi:MAG: discoidin domain-containing protein [Myxococcota bacterium]|nr:discoidin domain-containing protein [Myxococcota bacterium]
MIALSGAGRLREFSARHARGITLIGTIAAPLVFAGLGWTRRWISDDGLIVIRTVRQILAGNGPVFNAFERAEATTSTLWTWLLALAGAVTRLELAHLAVFGGLVLAVLGLATALAGTRQLHRGGASSELLVPAGVFVVLAVTAFWDYATSGLETGLCFAWIGAIWHQLVMLHPDASRRRQLGVAVLLGLGPLVRPDFAITSAVFLGAGWAIVRPRWRRTLLLAAAAGALPVVYEIFRAGYYGTLVPLPALAKGAARADWDRGLAYVVDFAGPYELWLPLGVLLVVALLARGHAASRRARVLVAAPLISGLLLCVYVVRVGGDFMHGRMMLPPTLLLLLPVLLLPVQRITVPAVLVLGTWAVATCSSPTSHPPHRLVGDERRGYLLYTGVPHPIDARPFRRAARPVSTVVNDLGRAGIRTLVTEGGAQLPMNPTLDAPVVFVVGRLGVGGAVAPLDGIVGDVMGLANPIGARITITHPAEGAGHQKVLSWPWLLADFAAPSTLHETAPAAVSAARRALACGELAELRASVREPMSPRRFWANLTGSLRRTRLAIPADPFDAELRFCGSLESITARVTASSSYEQDGWSATNLVDRVPASAAGAFGYSSEPLRFEDHAEWIELRLAAPRVIESVVLHPSNGGAGFPIDFTIETWDGKGWSIHVVRRGEPPPSSAQRYAIRGTTTDRVRLHVSKLATVGHDGHLLQLAELELRP